MNVFMVAPVALVTGDYDRDQWFDEPLFFDSIDEAGAAVRAAAEANPGSAYAIVLLGPVVASFIAERTPARPVEEVASLPQQRVGIELVHSGRKLGEGAQ